MKKQILLPILFLTFGLFSCGSQNSSTSSSASIAEIASGFESHIQNLSLPTKVSYSIKETIDSIATTTEYACSLDDTYYSSLDSDTKNGTYYFYKDSSFYNVNISDGKKDITKYSEEDTNKAVESCKSIITKFMNETKAIVSSAFHYINLALTNNGIYTDEESKYSYTAVATTLGQAILTITEENGDSSFLSFQKYELLSYKQQTDKIKIENTYQWHKCILDTSILDN